MEPILSGVAQPSGEQGLADQYRHLRPVYFPYPGVLRLSKSFGQRDYAKAANNGTLPSSALLLALSAPGRVSFKESARYHSGLRHEIAALGTLLGGRPRLQQWDFGAAPRLFTDAQIVQLVDALHRNFTVTTEAAAVFSVTLDALDASLARVESLRGLGFNELCILLGPRGYDHRATQLVASARHAGYRAVQIAIPGHLAWNNAFGLARCLQDAVRLAPDRIAVQGPQIGSLHLRLLEQAGYDYAGVDLFVRTDSKRPLSRLMGGHRRFPQGDCRLAGSNLLGIGISALSVLGTYCSQNTDSLVEYCRLTTGEALPIARGTMLNRDQLLRRAVMQTLLCDFELSVEAIEQVFSVDFNAYFSSELDTLRHMQKDGLVLYDEGWISIPPKGQPLVRLICAAFADNSDLG